jgi:hypothetical protein
MPIQSPDPSQSSSVLWGVALAVTSAVLIGAGAIVWAHREPPAPDLTAGPGAPPRMIRQLPSATDEVPLAEARVSRGIDLHPPSRVSPPGLYSVEFAVENGTRVVKIRAAPQGDELVVDAATGRLLETRPSRPTAPPPMGRFTAPFIPAN